MNPQVTSKPQMIDEVDRRLIQLEMEKLSLRKETKRDALKRVEQIGMEMKELQEKQVRYCLFRPVGSGGELGVNIVPRVVTVTYVDCMRLTSMLASTWST